MLTTSLNWFRSLEELKSPSLIQFYLVSAGCRSEFQQWAVVAVRLQPSEGWGHWQDCTLSVVITVIAFPPQNTLTAEELSPEDSLTLSPKGQREYPDLRAAHRPFPKEQFRPESTSLQRDGPRSFLLDLPNFPDLSKADINGQNPNIQVQIYVSIWLFYNLFYWAKTTFSQNNPSLPTENVYSAI